MGEKKTRKATLMLKEARTANKLAPHINDAKRKKTGRKGGEKKKETGKKFRSKDVLNVGRTKDEKQIGYQGIQQYRRCV